MSRRFSKHNITGSEAHQPRPIAYMRKGFIARRSRKFSRLVFTLCLVAASVTLLSMWLVE
jgi:hypothetical protein